MNTRILFPRLLIVCFAFCVTASVSAQSSEADSTQTRATIDRNGASRLETDMSVPSLGEERRPRIVGSLPKVPMPPSSTPLVVGRFDRLLMSAIQSHLGSPYHYAGTGPDSASADAGVSSRLLASFLSWMQERKAPVFVAATCNNAAALPPELIRKGRFDELFFVDLPNQTERKQIFSIQLSKRKRDPGNFDLDPVALAAKGYSGAEIGAAVETAMYVAYAQAKVVKGGKGRVKDPPPHGQGPDVDTQTLVDALKSTVPLSTTRAEEIEALRTWARDRAVPASIADADLVRVSSR